MTSVHPAVDWVLDQLAPVVDSVATDYSLRDGDPVVLKRVDRDNSQVYDGSQSVDMTDPIHKREAQLKTGAFAGASFADQGGDLVGTEPMVDGDVVVSVLIEGMTYREYGHIDPDGAKGIPFGELVNRIRDALYDEVSYPSVDDPRMSYRYLTIDGDPQSDGWADFYRHSLDVTLHGYEDLS